MAEGKMVRTMKSKKSTSNIDDPSFTLSGATSSTDSKNAAMTPLNWSDPVCLKETSSSSSSKPQMMKLENIVKVNRNTNDFKEKYQEFKAVGKGHSGVVFAGIRLSDSKLVAIKHIPIDKVQYMWVKKNGFYCKEISEVVLMAQAAGLFCNGSWANRGVIGLLDVYELEDEVLIIMERPLKAMDLNDFYEMSEGQIPEYEAKTIFQQLVTAALLTHRNGIFHRDLKPDNILVSMVQGNISIWMLDFGCATFRPNQEKPYTQLVGAYDFAPPEYYLQRQYSAEPTTVWQIGAMLYSLYSEETFHTMDFINKRKPLCDHLSYECKDFLNQCLNIDPRQRPRLSQLLRHPWLTTPSSPPPPPPPPRPSVC
ncbi:serine/threonine-protein kinase pim-2-like [Gouania willdenowi]|uniref:serine/threonine-protein kinase pim-2-like n=1 Tax=Gouania willdenowi TaxID=441366 RepID=UPI0010565AB0|nr:serine/threonine-protein kinase pim-2-like [Gouania willdenowi]